jgi:outer membrane protein
MRSAILLIAGLVLIVAPAAAQEPARAPQPLSLAEARALAAEHNPRYRQAQNAADLARSAERRSRAAFLPGLSLSYGSGGYVSRTLTGLDPYGRPVRLDEPVGYTSSSSSQSVSLTGLTLFDGGARYRELRAAQADEAAARAGVEVEADALEAELARGYYDARRRAELIRVEEALLAAARARHAATERLLRIAAASPLDLLGAEVTVAEHERALANAQGEAQKAQLALSERLGLSDAPAWVLTTEPPAPFDPTGLEADSLVARAIAASPQIARAEAERRAAEQRRRAAGASRWPTLSGQLGFGRSIGAERYEALFDPNPLNQTLNFGLSLSLPLFSQYQTTHRIAQAKTAASNATEQARAARLAVEREVRSALIDLASAWRAADLAERAAALAERRLELATRQYEIGALRFGELQDAIEQSARTRRDAVGAAYDFATSLAALEAKLGAPLAAR